ncbi:PucR family transcriptional regulator [Alteribacillus sp. HJP-4]|uniref:PucR family transcriptional regulator n=1 Tax=Alteribacillus sp. HJP-4 TaxID=2775394 RepID=UPI0035CD02C8
MRIGVDQMIEKLQAILPDVKRWADVSEKEKNQYTVYETPAQEKIAINLDTLAPNEKALVNTLLKKVQEKPFEPGNQALYDYLMEESAKPDTFSRLTYFRFIHIHGRKLYETRLELTEALSGYFDENVLITFLSEHDLIAVIGDIGIDTSIFHADEIAEILMGDLFLDVKVYSGRRVHAEEMVSSIYQVERRLFQALQEELPKVKAFTGYDMLPFALPAFSSKERQQLLSYTLAGMERDDEMLETLYHFFQCHLNISSTAKTLHMHRNTLQYRLDKITERTGMDIRQFPAAVPMYLLIKKAHLTANP